MMKAQFIRLAATAAVAVSLNLSAWGMGSPSSPSNPSAPSESARWKHLDPKNKVPSTPLNQALTYFEKYESKIKNKNYLTVMDFTQHSSKYRFYLINLKSGAVEVFQVAHGAGSEKNNSGWVPGFSNKDSTHLSSVGFFMTAETYNGSHGYSLKLDGLNSTNSNARSRTIVVHPADYVNGGNPIGRSWGCPALNPSVSASVIAKIKGGSLMYSYGGG